MARSAARAIVLLGLLMTVLLAPGLASVQASHTERSIHYTLPTGVAIGSFVFGGSIGADPCAIPCLAGPGEHRIGNPLAVLDAPITDLIVQINDDVYGQLGATALCISSAADGSCDSNDYWLGARCGPYILPGTIAAGQIIVVGLTYRNQPGGTCGATDGILTLQWS